MITGTPQLYLRPWRLSEIQIADVSPRCLIRGPTLLESSKYVRGIGNTVADLLIQGALNRKSFQAVTKGKAWTFSA